MRKVTKANLRPWNSIFGPFKSHFWELDLECGHFVERRIRWLPQEGSMRARGYAAMHRSPSMNRLPPAPKRARCEKCRSEAKKEGKNVGAED